MNVRKTKKQMPDCYLSDNCNGKGCKDYPAKRDLMQKIIDGQATPEEQIYYDEIIAKCNECRCKEYCDQELAIKNLIRTKLDKKRVPLDVLEKIKTGISKIG